MAQALASGFVLREIVSASQIRYSDPHESAAQQFHQRLGQAVRCASNLALIQDADVIVLAVKPQKLSLALAEVPDDAVRDRLFVSVVAGATCERLAALLRTQRIVRVMPNTPAIVGAGAAAYACGPGATPHDAILVGRLLQSVGYAVQLPESALDAVTGLSGSGPAFVFQFIEAMADAGVLAGLTRQVAAQLALQTVWGATRLMQESNEHPAVLKDRVASPGGTTMAGLHALDSGGFRATVMNAVLAATKRSEQLAKE